MSQRRKREREVRGLLERDMPGGVSGGAGARGDTGMTWWFDTSGGAETTSIPGRQGGGTGGDDSAPGAADRAGCGAGGGGGVPDRAAAALRLRGAAVRDGADAVSGAAGGVLT